MSGEGEQACGLVLGTVGCFLFDSETSAPNPSVLGFPIIMMIGAIGPFDAYLSNTYCEAAAVPALCRKLRAKPTTSLPSWSLCFGGGETRTEANVHAV